MEVGGPYIGIYIIKYLCYDIIFIYDIIFRYNINTISIYPRPASEGGRVRYHFTPDPYLRTFGRRRIGWLASPTLLLIISFEYFIFYYILHIYILINYQYRIYTLSTRSGLLQRHGSGLPIGYMLYLTIYIISHLLI